MPSWAPGPIPPHPVPPWPPRPFPPPRPHPFAPLDINYVKVHTRITDQVAVTSVDQEFYNPNSARLEGTFVFPVPKGAHIDKFTMEIDGKQVEAELLPADKARQIYEDIVRKLKDPALLEYAGRDVFKVRIFPIEPNSKKRITLSYTEILKADNGLISYVLPLNTEKFSAKPIRNVSVKVDLETKRPLKSIYSPSHSVEVKRHGADRATAGYEATDVRPDTDFALYFAPEKDEIGVNLLTHRTGDEDGYFLLLASPGVDQKEKQVVMKDIAFVLDTSGSMAGKKLEQAKKALQFCVENLNDGDRFEIVRFSTEVEPLFDKLVEATEQNRARADEFIKDLKPIGGTAIDDALRKALALRPGGEDRPFVVIFLTDGRPTIGTTDRGADRGRREESQRGSHARLLLRHRHGREHASARPDHRGHPRRQPIRPAGGRPGSESLKLLLEDQRAGAGKPHAQVHRRHPRDEALSLAAAGPVQGRAVGVGRPLLRPRRCRCHRGRHSERRSPEVHLRSELPA